MNKRKQNLKYERPQTQAKNWHKYDKIIQPIIKQECKPFTLKDLTDFMEKQSDFMETSYIYSPEELMAFWSDELKALWMKEAIASWGEEAMALWREEQCQTRAY